MVFNNFLQTLGQGSLGLIAGILYHLADVRDPALHIFKSPFISLVVRYVNDFRLTPGHLLYLPGQVSDGNFLAIPYIENLTFGPGIFGQKYHQSNDVINISKAAGLVPISENGDGMIQHSLLNESRYYHTISAGLTRTNCVKQPQYYYRQLLLVEIG